MNTYDADYFVRQKIGDLRNSPKAELHLDGAPFTQLENIPEAIFDLEKIRILEIGGGFAPTRTKITYIPADIQKLKNLEVLNLSKNQIRTLPKELFELSNLRQLYLSGNDLEFIPPEIAKLKNLIKLDLSNNRLRLLPKEIGELKHLETLDLENNKIESVPKEIGKLKNLIRISLENNGTKNIPVEILNQSTAAIINYCKSLLEEKVVNLYESKLLIVGEGGVGKTCLMNRIIHDKIDLQESTTEGIDINRFYFSTKATKRFRVNIWDFGGQEIYHSTHQFFLTKRSLYIFVWTARSDEVNFDYWLNVIKLLSDNAPVLIVLNKIDERIRMIDEHLIQKSFNNVVGFHKVSALNSTGMKDLVEDIQTKIISLQHIGDELPKVWLDIREYLENLNKNYISYVEYKDICAEYRLDAQRADLLSQYYHDLGVFLHFQENAVLKDILFLKPTWATNAVYKIIDTKEVIKHYGRFHLTQLKSIWSDYPEEKHIHLVELMKKFELCFQIPNTEEYIIPELLQPSSPDFRWDYENNLRFEYHYDFMPSGIITRFIVLLHNLIHDNVFWKNGLIIKRENAKALLVSDRFKRRISIWINGLEKKDLLSIIRERIDYIHKTLNSPPVKQMIKCICKDCMNNREPSFYDYATIKNFYFKGKKEIPCPHSTEDVSIELLLGGIENLKAQTEEEILKILQELRSQYSDRESFLEKANSVVQLQPNFMGLGINLNELLKRIFEKDP